MTEATDREVTCATPRLPTLLCGELAGYNWFRDTVGESGGTVYRLGGDAAGLPDLFLKHGAGAFAGDVVDEFVRLRWIAGRLSVPEVVTFVQQSGEAWLLTTALPGRTAWQILDDGASDPIAVVDALAAFLRRLHALPVDSFPFDAGHKVRLALARGRVDAGLVEVDAFDDARAGWSAEEVWEAMRRLLPFEAERVVTHGDYSLDNLLMQDGAVTGCIDVGRAGVADRYQDLAILWNCLGEFDRVLQDRLFASYGIAEPDRRRLDFHLMLDEMF